MSLAVIVLAGSFAADGQVPLQTGIVILKAEDSRRYDDVLAGLMRNPSAAIRERAALAAGRIGDAKALPELTNLLESDQSEKVRAMAAFAIGEIESTGGSEAIIKALTSADTAESVRARAIEAAGKIAADPKDPSSARLGAAILQTLDGGKAGHDTVLLGITAVLRAHPAGSDVVIAKFLTNQDERIGADAANTMSRLRARNANNELRKLTIGDLDPIARANAARALGAAGDQGSASLLLTAATEDAEERVRISAIRSLGSIKAVSAAERLLDRTERLLAQAKASHDKRPTELNELTEIASVLGRLLAGTTNPRALKLLADLEALDNGWTPEIAVAKFRVKPADFDFSSPQKMTWHQLSTAAALFSELAGIAEPKTSDVKEMKTQAPAMLRAAVNDLSKPGVGVDHKSYLAVPDLLTAFAKYKTADLDQVLRESLVREDAIIRATAAGLLAGQKPGKENVDALKTAFDNAFVRDKVLDDAQLGTLDALNRLDKRAGVGSFLIALNSPDYLVRKKAFEILADKDLQREFPGIPTSLENARAKHKDLVLPYSPAFGTRLGQILNTDADYRRALSRKDGSVKAVVSTTKGTFSIDFYPEEAPLTVDNWIKLARAGYFNGIEVHRVVPNFVMQDGDPRGDGNGGPEWSIRCEINMLPYDRGAVGMALSGKDTGGSQWFVTHSPQPHLDGGYTVFGRVSEGDMKFVDRIVRGDRILSVRVVESRARR